LGQILGTIAGAALGSQIGGGTTARVFAGLAGAAAGAWIGGEIAKALSERDKQALNEKAIEVSATAQAGQQVSWTAPESGKSVTITPSPTREEDRTVQVAHISQVAPPPAGFKFDNAILVAQKNARLRASPSTIDNNVIGSYKAGDNVEVAGKLPTGNWYLATRNKVAIGYISGDLLAKPAVSQKVAAPSAKPEMSGGIDLDAAPKKSDVSVKATCRDISFDLDKNTQTSTSCKGPDGAWNLG
jgi:surface antigen